MPIMTRHQIADTSMELQRLEKLRVWHMKSKNMIGNRLRATVAGHHGYQTGLSDSERKKKFKEADKFIEQVRKAEIERKKKLEEAGNATKQVGRLSKKKRAEIGGDAFEHELSGIINTGTVAFDGFEDMMLSHEKKMIALAEKLPVVDWVKHDDQRGFGILSLAIVVGETGDLFNYSTPQKVWKRLGCAPFTKDGETRMGATWKSRKKSKSCVRLSDDEWSAFGYSPRRRSVSFLIGENLMKLNKGAYRLRWLESKIRAAETHPEWEWSDCDACKKSGDGNCGTCGGTGKKCQQAHRHGMLLSAKLLLKNLWIEWNGEQRRGYDQNPR